MFGGQTGWAHDWFDRRKAVTKKAEFKGKTEAAKIGEPMAPAGYTLARVGRSRVILATGQQVTLNKLPKGSWVLVPV